MLRSRPIRKQSGKSVESVCPEEEEQGYGGKDLQRRKVLSLEWKSEWVVDNNFLFLYYYANRQQHSNIQ